MSFSDGTFTSAVMCAPQTVMYPLLNTPSCDTNTKVYSREYVQELANFTPSVRSNTATLPSDGVWPSDNAAYLVSESDLSPFSGTLARFVRRWANVPPDQVEYSTMTITKPDPASLAEVASNFAGTNAAYYLYSSALFAATNEVYGPLVNVAVKTSIGGGSWNVTAVSHSITAGDDIAISANSSAYGYVAQKIPSANVTVVNANFVTVAGVSGNVGIVNGEWRIGPYLRTYTPGVDRVRTKRTTSFYLPNVTANIASPSDIPIPSPATNAEELLQLVIAHTSGYQPYDAEELKTWLGDIWQQTVIEIDMANL